MRGYKEGPLQWRKSPGVWRKDAGKRGLECASLPHSEPRFPATSVPPGRRMSETSAWCLPFPPSLPLACGTPIERAAQVFVARHVTRCFQARN